MDGLEGGAVVGEVGAAFEKWVMERTSPEEPLAIERKARSSLVVPRSKPSAMLLETEREARSIWSR